jgi:uncharacterized protein (TIRG00374 family)
MKKLHTLLLVLGAAFLVYLVTKIGIGELCRQVGLLGWGLVPLILCEGVAEFIHVVGWRYCLSGPHRSLSLVRLFGIRLAGYAINYLTPTAAMGGEVTKAALLASNRPGPEAVTGVLIGKICFAFAHLLFVVSGSVIVLWRINLPPALWLGMSVSGGLIAAGMGAFLLIQKHGKLGGMVRWLVLRKVGGPWLHQLAQGITEVDEALKTFYRQRPGDLLKAVGWHQLGYCVGILQTWLFFNLLHQDVSWVLAAALWFLGMWFDLLTFAVPQNLGTLEGTRILALRAIGYSSLLGMTYGVALRLAQLFWSVLGLMVHALILRQVAGKSPRSVSGVHSWSWLLLLSVAAFPVRAADDDPSTEYRTGVALQLPILRNLSGTLNPGYRWNPDLKYQTFTMGWPALTYKAAHWAQVSGGLRTLYTDNQNSADKLELRPYAGLKLFLPNKLKCNIYNHTRYEFRDTQDFATHDWSGYSRIRTQFGMEVPLTSREQAWHPTTWYGRVDVEPFYRFDKNTVDPLRAEVALGHILSDHVRLELVYSAQFTRPSGASSLEFTENIISLNFKIGLKEGLLHSLLNPNHGD